MGTFDRLSRWFHNLGLRGKLGLVVAVLAIPVVVVASLYVSVKDDEASLADSEKAGATYIARGILPLIRDVQKHRTLEVQVFGGDTSALPARAATAGAIESDLETLAAIDRKHPGWGGASLVADIRSRWDQIKARPDVTTTQRHLESYDGLIHEAIFPLIFKIGNSSKLYNLSDTATLNAAVGITQFVLPHAEAISAAQAYGVAIANDRFFPGQPVSARLALLAQGQVRNAFAGLGSLTTWLEGAMAADPGYERALRQRVTEIDARTTPFLRSVELLVSGSSSDSALVVSTGAAALAEDFALYEAAADLIASDLSARATAAGRAEFITIAITTVAILFACALAWLVVESVSRPLNRLAKAADSMSLGDLDAVIDVHGTNETGRLADSLRRMQTSLRGAIERLRQRRSTAA